MAHASPEEGNRSPKRIKTCDVLATIRRAFSEMDLPSEPEQPSLVVETVFTEMERSERVKELAPLKLLKLIFFAHGIAAAVFNKRLIREEFEGWPFGPVARSVYDDLGYKGNVPLPFLGEASKIKPSQMMELCIALAVAAHGRDSTYIIKFKSHIPLWHEYHGDVWDHVVMPFNGIKEWFSQDDIIVQEVLAGMLPRVKPDVRNSIFTLLARNPSLRSGFSDQAISAEAARKLNKHVVIWPGQSAINAMIVASTKSTSLYDSVCTQLDEGSQEYLAVLARLAGLGDWVALARLGDHVDLESDLEHRRSRFKGTVSDAQSDEERYACLFMPLARFCSLLMKTPKMPSRCGKNANLITPRWPWQPAVTIPPYSFLRLETLANHTHPLHATISTQALRKLQVGDASYQAKYLFGMLAARIGIRDDARIALMSVAVRGFERACESLFNMFPSASDFSLEELEALAKATQRGRVALASYYTINGDDAKAGVLFGQGVDTLNRFGAISSGDDALALEVTAMYNNLVAVALPEE
jgi:hypothetical protein